MSKTGRNVAFWHFFVANRQIQGIESVKIRADGVLGFS